MNTRWDTRAGRIDVLVSARGPSNSTINWRTVAPASQVVEYEGHQLRIASLEDLLVMKLSVGRPHDVAVAEELAPGSSEAFARHVANGSGPSTTSPQ